MTIKLIGVGNPDCGDDAIAGKIVDALRTELGEKVLCLSHSGEASSLLDEWSASKSVYLIDACSSDDKPGTLKRFDVRQEPMPAELRHYSSHSFGLHEAVELGRQLDMLPEKLIVFAIEGKNFEPGSLLSPELEDALPKICNEIVKEIKDA